MLDRAVPVCIQGSNVSPNFGRESLDGGLTKEGDVDRSGTFRRVFHIGEAE